MSGRPAGRIETFERRLAARYASESVAESVFVVGSRILNISTRGVMLDAPARLAPGSLLRLHLVVEGHKAEIDGVIRRCVPRADGSREAWGVAVEFRSIGEAVLARLDRALARSVPPGAMAEPAPVAASGPASRAEADRALAG